jgi:subtilisin family serine protease
MPLLGVDCYVMAVPPERSSEAVAAELGRQPEVSWSEPVHTYRAQGEARPAAFTHNDPLYPVQPAAREWRLAELHRMATGRGVSVAVIDSMVDRTQPDLRGQVELTENFVAGRPAPPEVHGTAVAGVIAAQADNGIGIAGVAPQARVLGLRACWQEPPAQPGASAPTLCDSLSLGKALQYAIEHKAQIINMSLSGPDDLLLDRLVDAALADGLVVVAAYDRAAPGGGFPASHKGVVAVTDEERTPVPAGVLDAPGQDIPAPLPGDHWSVVTGSSFAAAQVSGLYALLRQHAPHAHGASAIVVNVRTASIDACATLLQKPSPCDCNCGAPRERVASAER